MSSEIDLIRSRSCSGTAVGVWTGNLRLGSRVCVSKDLLDTVVESLKLESALSAPKFDNMFENIYVYVHVYVY